MAFQTRSISFLQATPLQLTRSGLSRHMRRQRCPHDRKPPRISKLRKLRTSCQYSSNVPDPPELISYLDELEKERREEIESEPVPELSKEVEEALFQKHPSIRQLSEEMSELMAKGDYDPNNWHAYTWAYNYLIPWAPSRALQAAIALAVFWSTRKVVKIIRRLYSPEHIMTVMVRFDAVSTLLLAAVIPLTLTLYLITRKRGEPQYDGLTRTLVMFTLSSIPLLPIAAITSTANVSMALVCGIFVRLAMQLTSLWYWVDLRREVFISQTVVGNIIRPWRWLVALFVIAYGTVIRLTSLMDLYPFQTVMEKNADAIRISLGKRFPVALSLCNDPRGLFLGASLILIAVLCHMVYLVIFAVDFGRTQQKHRKLNSWLSHYMISRGIFQPNEHPQELLGKLSAVDKAVSYTPSSAMLLRREDSVLEVESRFISTEAAMPIFSYLDNEEEILKKEGASQWMKPNDELVPVSDQLSEEKRSLDGLLTWAQPLLSEETDLSFAEYFQTIQDGDYQYDNDSDSWVFNNDALLGDSPDNGVEGDVEGEADGAKSSRPIDADMDGDVTPHEDWLRMPELPVDDETIAKFITDPQYQPYIKKYMDELRELQKDDDTDTPSPPTIFV